LRAFEKLSAQGVEVVPVWNKSNREHTFIGSEPQSVFDAAQAAVTAAGRTKGWHVDADHIRLEKVDRFVPCSDFFTIDVADSIGKPAPAAAVAAFLARHPELVGTIARTGAGLALAQDNLRLRAGTCGRTLRALRIGHRH